MMSAAYREDMVRGAAKKAKRIGQRPVLTESILSKEERVPFIGNWVPRGYTPTGTCLFVDSSGYGTGSEPALTQEQFLQALKPGFAYAVVEMGQFQVYVQEFIPPKKRKE